MKQKIIFLLAALLIVLNGCQQETKNSESNNNSNSEQYYKTIYVNPKKNAEEGTSYQTLNDAVNYVNQNPPANESERIIIKLSAGIYREHTKLTAPFITYIADDDSSVTITYYYGSGNTYTSMPNEEISIASSASTIISETAHDFQAEGITFENSYNLYTTDEEIADYSGSNKFTVNERKENPALKKFQTQACCIRMEADRSVFKNCRFISRQDTIYLTCMARCYFENCFIEGTADFICGDATAWFENCQLNCPYNAGYVSASASGSHNPFGYMFHNCSITKECNVEGQEPPKDGDYTLGRPWRCTPTVIYWNCKMDTHIVTGEDRFVNMVSEYSRNDCTIIECNSMDIHGTPLDMENIAASYESIMTEKEITEKYSLDKFFKAKYNKEKENFEKKDNWKPTLH